MEEVLKNFKVETKTLEAAKNRKPNSVLVPGIDTLQVVYDLYTRVQALNDDQVGVNFLFLHGSGMSRIIWEYYLAQFTSLMSTDSQWQVNKTIVLDQVTHGDSAELNRDKLSVDFDWTDGAKDACKVALKEFNQNEVNIIVGHSMGGHQALCCGVLCPDFFDLIIPIEPVLIPHVVSKDIRAPTVVHSRFFNAIWNKTKDTFDNDKEFRQYMETSSFYTNAHPWIRDRIIDFERVPLDSTGKLRTKVSQGQNTLCYMTLNPGASWLIANLKYITTPVYCMLEGIANWTPEANRQVLEKDIEKITIDIVEEGDHLMNLEIPDVIINRILKYMDTFMEVNYKKFIGKPQDLAQAQRRVRFQEVYDEFCKQRITDYSKSRAAKL